MHICIPSQPVTENKINKETKSFSRTARETGSKTKRTFKNCSLAIERKLSKIYKRYSQATVRKLNKIYRRFSPVIEKILKITSMLSWIILVLKFLHWLTRLSSNSNSHQFSNTKTWDSGMLHGPSSWSRAIKMIWGQVLIRTRTTLGTRTQTCTFKSSSKNWTQSQTTSMTIEQQW